MLFVLVLAHAGLNVADLAFLLVDSGANKAQAPHVERCGPTLQEGDEASSTQQSQ